jgi:hypothetical protein
MNKNHNYSQKGGLGFGDAIKDALLSISMKKDQSLLSKSTRRPKNGKITDIDIIRLLLSDVNECCILSDMSTYSFVFQLFMKNYKLLDTIDMPGLGKKRKEVGSFCCKLCFVSNPPLSLDEYPEGKDDIKVIKYSVLPSKAQQEGNIQGQLWRSFPMPFVPDVIAQHNLSNEEFKEMFARILIPSYRWSYPEYAMPSFSEFTEVEHNKEIDSPGVMGSREGIYNYIIAQFTKGISVHVILMEMIGVVSEHQIFKPLRQLTSIALEASSIRVAAQMVLAETRGIAPHDIHEDNAFGTMDGTRTTIIDLGGILDMSNENDVHKLVRCFDMCDDERYKITSIKQDKQNLLELNGMIHMQRIDDPTEQEQDKLRIMDPSLEELCLFLDVDMTRPENITDKAYRQQLKNNLVKKFRTEIQQCFADFGKEGPTMKNVHFRLMILAFIDFMYNRIALNHPYCQSRQILERVYPVGRVITSIGSLSIFKDFRSFLKGFKLRTLPSKNNVDKVVANIEEHLRPCPSDAKTELKSKRKSREEPSQEEPSQGRPSQGRPSKRRRTPSPEQSTLLPPILVPPERPSGSFFSRLANRFTDSRVNPKNWGWPNKTAGKHKDKRRHNCKTKRKRKFV